MSYNPALQFNQQFYPSEGADEYISIINQMITGAGDYCFVKDSHKIQIFQGIDTRELPFTRETFLAIIDHLLGIDPGDIITNFTKYLNHCLSRQPT